MASTLFHLQNGFRIKLKIFIEHLLCVRPRPAVEDIEMNEAWTVLAREAPREGRAPGRLRSWQSIERQNGALVPPRLSGPRRLSRQLLPAGSPALWGMREDEVSWGRPLPLRGASAGLAHCPRFHPGGCGQRRLPWGHCYARGSLGKRPHLPPARAVQARGAAHTYSQQCKSARSVASSCFLTPRGSWPRRGDSRESGRQLKGVG